MFSNTAYEALYEYIGLALHSRFLEILTSQRVFLAAVLLIFGVGFFVTATEFFSRYIPGVLVKRRSVPLSKFVKIVFCLFLGMSLLRVGAETGIHRFSGESWHANTYIKDKRPDITDTYRVSFIFDLLSRSAEELAAFVNRTVDKLFRSAHSNLEAPDFFYKAILYAGSSTLANPEIREAVDFYTEECVERILPEVGGREGLDRLDGMFARDGEIDEKLKGLALDVPGQPGYNCYDAKENVRQRLKAHADETAGPIPTLINQFAPSGVTMMSETAWQNTQMSMALVDHYLGERESFGGIQKGAQPPSGAARVFQYVNRFFSWDGMASMFGGREGHGAALAAERSQEFSENLTRAPHVAGFIKLCLIAIFPWLIFPVVAGYWRVLLLWWLVYFSVLMWAPVWTLLYHVVVSLSLSADTLQSLGRLSDGISLYSANLVTSRMNYMYGVYSWIQLMVGAVLTGGLLWFARPLMSDTRTDSAPEFIDDAGRLAGTATSVGKFV